jgi:hypothetical protein
LARTGSVIVTFTRVATAAPKCSADASICAPRWRIVGGIRPFMRWCRRGAMSIGRHRMAGVLRTRVMCIGRSIMIGRLRGTRNGRRALPNSVGICQRRTISGIRRGLMRRSSRRGGTLAREVWFLVFGFGFWVLGFGFGFGLSCDAGLVC